jgi:2-(1,2-epoxy-1,2-dihydrophenyl)acetyl-CoA isomerase
MLKVQKRLQMKNYSSQHLDVSHDQTRLTLCFNRPEVRNAIDLEIATDLLRLIRQAGQDSSVRMIILSGNGGVFSAGANLKKMSESPRIQRVVSRITTLLHEVITHLFAGEKFTIASIPGYVGGVSLGLALACDLRIASSSAIFQVATTKIGLVANGGSTFFLPRLVGLGRAHRILFLGERIEADEGQRIGLINEVVPPEQLPQRTRELADQILSGPVPTLTRLKKVVHAGLTSELRRQLSREKAEITWSSTTRDFTQRMKDFLGRK